MNSLIETLNRWGGRIPDFAWPMLWQSSVLIAVLFVFDLAARRKVRASVRYALWLVVLVKLLLPPTLALPTSLAWWVRPPAPPPKAQARTTAFVVRYGDFVPANLPPPAPAVFVPPPAPLLSGVGRVAVTWVVVGTGLLVWLVARWRQVARDVRKATVAPELLNEALGEAQRCIKLPRRVRLLVTKRAMSPAVCGLFRPVILLPQSLVERLTSSQLRAVLLHELAHLRRGDVWVNCAQALLQIFYWWHPLLWLANARIRRVREEAVDDAVMLALADDGETYAPTLLEVAKLAFNRSLASLGLVGIMESRSALRQRIERLVDFRPPQKAGITIASALCVVAFAALAVPMEQAPPTSEKPSSTKDKSDSSGTASTVQGSSNSADSKTNVTQLVQRGRLLLEAGKLDEAEAKFKEAVILDPQNRAAFYYLNLVKEARYNEAERRRGQEMVEIEQARLRDSLPVPNPAASSNLIGEFEISGTKPDSVTQYDYTTGIATVSNGGRVRYKGLTLTADSIAVDSKAKTITADGHVRIARGSESNERWVGEHMQITSEGGTVTVEGSVYKTSGGVVGSGGQTNDGESQSSAKTPAREGMPNSFISNFRMKFYAPLSNETMNATPRPTSALGTNLIFIGKGRQAIAARLDKIRLDSVSFKRLPLGEVVALLNDEARRRDPEQKGIHFMIDPNAATASTPIPQTDPTTGLPIQTAPSEPADISTISINLDPPLHDVRLADVMEAIVRVANKPIKYSLEDYAVVFSLRGPEVELLYTRTFQVDTKALYKRLEDAVGISLDDVGSSIGKGGFLTMPGVDPQEAEGIQNPRTLPPDLPQTRDRGGITYITRTNPMHLVSVAVATFLRSLGVDLASPKALALGKSVIWKDRTGTLLVRATKEDLDAIGRALADLEAKPQSAINAIGSPTAVVTNKSASESSNRLAAEQNKIEASAKVMDGRILLEARKLDDAEAKLREAVALDSTSRTAFYYLNLVKEARFTKAERQREPEGAREIEQALLGDPSTAPNSHAKPEPAPLFIRTFQVNPKALENVTGVSLVPMVEMLPGVSRQEMESALNPPTVPADLPQRQNGGGLRFITRTNFMQQASVAMATFFRSLGVDLASPKGMSVFWKDRTGTLLVRATKEDLDAIGRALADLEAKPQSAINAIRSPTAVVTNKSASESSNRLNQAIKDKVPLLGDIPLVGKLFRSESNAFRAEAFGTSNSPAASAGRSGLAAGPAAPLQPSSSPEQLQTRVFRVNPNSFYKSLESVSPFARTNINAALRDFFLSLGVDLRPPKNSFWNERNGGLLVRATVQDLDVIEKAIEVLSHPSPQINIKARFVEIDQEDIRAHGFDWFLGSILLTNGGDTNSVGKAPTQLQGVLTDPQFRVLLRALEQRNGADISVGKASPQLRGVLTDPQFRVLLRALEQRNGADVLAAPEVTTVSGRQAQIQVVDLQTVVTGINPPAQLPPGMPSANGLTNSLYQTQTMPFGPVLDVIPYLAADGYTINMTVIPTVTEFLGYDDPAAYIPTNSAGQLKLSELPLPHFRVRQMTVNASVRDGQTLMLIGTVTTEVLKKPDGSTETKDVSGAQKKQLIVFVTPTLIDEAGHRLHSDDEPSPGPK